jgi:hypothetical protein
MKPCTSNTLTISLTLTFAGCDTYSAHCTRACNQAQECGILRKGNQLGENLQECLQECSYGERSDGSRNDVLECLDLDEAVIKSIENKTTKEDAKYKALHNGESMPCLGTDYSAVCRDVVGCISGKGYSDTLGPPVTARYAFATRDAYTQECSKYYCSGWDNYCVENSAFSCGDIIDSAVPIDTDAVRTCRSDNRDRCGDTERNSPITFRKAPFRYICSHPGVQTIQFDLIDRYDLTGAQDVFVDRVDCGDKRFLFPRYLEFPVISPLPIGSYVPRIRIEGKLPDPSSEIPPPAECGARPEEAAVHFKKVLEALAILPGDVFCIERTRDGLVDVFPGTGIIPIPPFDFTNSYDVKTWRPCENNSD